MSAEFNTDNVVIEAEFGTVTATEIKEIFSGTTAYWQEHDRVTKKDCLYIYTDYLSDGQGGYVCGTKLGDGTSLISALSFNERLWAKMSDIPTELSQLADDPTHRLVTDEEKTTWNNKADISDIPTKVSELDNDLGFIDNTVDDLTNYYDKSTTDDKLADKADKADTYTKQEVDTALSAKANTADITSGDVSKAIYHLGFYLDSNGGLCQVNSL